MIATARLRRGTGALAALVAAGALSVPAQAETPLDAYPSPQAIAANAEFLAQVPAPSAGAAKVCVIDTGVTPMPDTASQIVERIALDGGSPDDIDHRSEDPLSGHGSFVASTIASQVDGSGAAGIWPAARIVSVRAFSRTDAGATASDYHAAIGECAQPGRGVTVINLSLGAVNATPYELAKLENRLTEAHAVYGISVVAAAGNDGNLSEVAYPARFAAAFAVGGTGGNGAFCGFSNRGAGLDISAMGCDLRATVFNGAVASVAGTSYSAPVVAGILAALRSYRRDLAPTAVEQLLVETAQRTSAGPVIDAAAAFRAAGLGHLVDAYRPPAAPRDTTAATGAARLDDERPARPRLRSATFRRGLMHLRIAKPRRGSDAIFRVNGRSYVRANGSLTLRLASWKPAWVLIEDKWGVRSEPLTVRRPTRR